MLCALLLETEARRKEKRGEQHVPRPPPQAGRPGLCRSPRVLASSPACSLQPPCVGHTQSTSTGPAQNSVSSPLMFSYKPHSKIVGVGNEHQRQVTLVFYVAVLLCLVTEKSLRFLSSFFFFFSFPYLLFVS